MKNKTSRSNGASGVFSVLAGMLVPLLLLLSVTAYAQNYAGSVRGTVTDPSGAALSGASVTLRDVAHKRQF